MGSVSFETFTDLCLRAQELDKAVRESVSSSLTTDLGEAGIDQFFRAIREVRAHSAIKSARSKIKPIIDNKHQRADPYPAVLTKSPAYLKVLALSDSAEGIRGRECNTNTGPKVAGGVV